MPAYRKGNTLAFTISDSNGNKATTFFTSLNRGMSVLRTYISERRASSEGSFTISSFSDESTKRYEVKENGDTTVYTLKIYKEGDRVNE